MSLLRDAALVAEELLEKVYRFPVHKALDPNNPRDFLTIVSRLSAATRGLTQAAEATALRTALDTLDVDWKNMSTDQRARVVDAARQVIAKTHTEVWPKLEGRFIQEATRVGSASRASSRKKYDFDIGVDLTSVDKEVLNHVAVSQGNFVRDEYGRRADAAAQTAKRIVEQGLEQGMGTTELGGLLSNAIELQQVGRSRAYWNLISTTFTNRARTYANLSSFNEAGVTSYIFLATLDERTSAQCRFLHNRRFPVKRALDSFRDVEESDDPDEVKTAQPWLQVGRDADSGSEFLYYKTGAGAQRRVADVVRSGVGNVDDRGEFANALGGNALARAGVIQPPVHGHCRSTIIADVPG